MHEISIGVRGTKPMKRMSNERLQRTAMLESNALIGHLLTIVSKSETSARKNISLDILLWILTIRMCRYRSPKSTGTDAGHKTSTPTPPPPPTSSSSSSATSIPSPPINDIVVDMHQQQIDCVYLMMAHMAPLMRSCILLGNRSTANKCVKIILVTYE